MSPEMFARSLSYILCVLKADCIKTGPGQNECKCSAGWVGDGLFCFPSSSCLNHSQCDENAICVPSTPNEVYIEI